LHFFESRYVNGTPITDGTLPALADAILIANAEFPSVIDQFNNATRPVELPTFKLDSLSNGDTVVMPNANLAQALDKPPYVVFGFTCGKLQKTP
jgi:tricarballylate dehydrogenase